MADLYRGSWRPGGWRRGRARASAERGGQAPEWLSAWRAGPRSRPRDRPPRQPGSPAAPDLARGMRGPREYPAPGRWTPGEAWESGGRVRSLCLDKNLWSRAGTRVKCSILKN